MTRSGKFTLPRIGDSLAQAPASAPEPAAEDAERRRPGPMAVAGRESAEAMTRMVEEQTAQRQRNAEEAEAWRSAQADGLVLVRLPLGAVGLDDLPRDRMALDAVAQSEAMEELKASIRARGQREPIEVFEDSEGRFQLKTGWRRLEALRQLDSEAPDGGFGAVLARVERRRVDRAALYVGMVEENAIREDVSFAEMAHVAIAMARDPETPAATPDEAVSHLYAALHKTKRSTIRRFVELLEAVGGSLVEARAVPKHLGGEAARLLHGDPARIARLRRALEPARDAAAQNAALAAFIAVESAPTPLEAAAPSSAVAARLKPDARQKYEFHHAELKVTARRGEVRIKAAEDFASMPRERLEAAIAAFRAKLAE
ncbi:MAG: ParB N-terminal domain-containing protein [Rubrimonas sp.]|uniref:ParB N-terminal domain-containing protein n=1 Tax=Rubrimonas sp. TaxID=2036015 RepID=UPI002FDE0DDE